MVQQYNEKKSQRWSLSDSLNLARGKIYSWDSETTWNFFSKMDLYSFKNVSCPHLATTVLWCASFSFPSLPTSRLWTNRALPIKSAYFLPCSPIPVDLTIQDVDTEFSEAGHTPTETDYFYEETLPVPEGEVTGEEVIPEQVMRRLNTVTQNNDTEESKIDSSGGEDLSTFSVRFKDGFTVFQVFLKTSFQHVKTKTGFGCCNQSSCW